LKVTGGPQSGLLGFYNDQDLIHLYDIIAYNYGKLPSEVAALSFEDLAVCVACLKSRSKRIDKILKRTTKKKSAVFPIVNLHDLILCL
jgi:hypothetical protein